ncbi:hypothetical protein SAMN04487934_107178 [Eubacterium ruminantium]|nr:hypothetical protein SAMN04487934_107178 [Eubacterium ruminantium]
MKKEELKRDFLEYYEGFKLKNITSPKYRHLFLILFWPFYLINFFTIERIASTDYHVIHCVLDDIIPFNEYFIIPYVIWYPFWISMLLYSVLFEVETFKKTMKYFILTYSISLTVYALWHSGHNMWPKTFPHDNFCTWLTQRIYAADYNTNICPSDHVIGAFAVVFAAADSKRLSNRLAMTVILTIAILITLSICFVKQHSALDILAAAPVVLLGYYVCFFRAKRKEKTK